MCRKYPKINFLNCDHEIASKKTIKTMRPGNMVEIGKPHFGFLALNHLPQILTKSLRVKSISSPSAIDSIIRIRPRPQRLQGHMETIQGNHETLRM
jgi:hypothetical protein